MKIFNWMQRRLNPNQQLLKDDEFGRGVKKGDQSASGPGAKTLLEQVDGRLGSWKDGILTIGTFGYDPLISQQQQQEEDIEHHGVVPFSSGSGTHDGIEDGDGHGCDSDDNYNDNGIIAHLVYGDDDEELNPLIPELRGSNIEKDRHNQTVVKVTVIGAEMDIVSSSSRRRKITLNQKRETKGERTTLADLFSADSADTKVAESWKAVKSSGKNKKTKNELEEEEVASAKKKVHTAHLFSKKFIPHISHGSRPMKKLHKLMRKMLKTKIHPDLEGPDGDDRENYATLKLQAEEDEATSDHHGDQLSLLLNFQLNKFDGATDESVSLLPIHGNQDAL